MFDPEPGSWYIVVTCANCKSTIYLFLDLNDGKGSLQANYIVKCPRCNHKGAYQARHYYHPPDPPKEPGIPRQAFECRP